jgi:hypothetical protein
MASLKELYQLSNPADEILPGLWLGNRQASQDDGFLRDKRISTVFNCTKDIPFHPSVRRQYRVPVDDNLQDDEIRNMELWSFETVYKIANEHKRAQARGDSILVHCAAGMQRSAAAVAMYLIAMKAIPTDQAILYIQSRRPIAFRPAANFERAIRGFERAFEKDVRPKLAPPE